MKATIQYIQKELSELYPDTEIEGFSRIILETVCGWSFTKQVVYRNEQIQDPDFEKIKEIVGRLKNFEPLQYILGETEFFGLKIKVNPSVLIPRPETEELVHWMINCKIKEERRILDIGTGSGCIAIALKSRLRNAEISGMDISEKALETAIGNALINDLDVKFFQADILNLQNQEGGLFDIIVSNPPYIMEKEKSGMHENVLHFEPADALFVPDDNPLVYYRAIASFAKKSLSLNGYLFFEINENLGSEMKSLLQDFGFAEIEIRKDINGKNRMAGCKKNN